MRTISRKWTLALATTLTYGALLGARPVQAQNTYADVPFNQGSLFYRPSGARPPTRAITPTPRTRFGLFRRPRANTILPAPRVMPPRTTVARPATVPATTYYQAPR